MILMQPDTQLVRVRFAPSPTGELHVGGARTALYEFLFARKHGGQVLLRVEDTDQKRYVSGSMERFIDDLRWLGITFDEGPEQGGSVGPYIQSERTDYYRDVARMLLDRDGAYYCFCTPERLKEVREAQQARGEQPGYDRHCRTLSIDDVKAHIGAGTPSVIRLKVPETGTIQVEDLIRGQITFDVATIDDQVLMKSDNFPTYHLAVVADDHAMGITHVIRGDEWLPSTPKHLLTYQALGWTPPAFAHVPLMLAADRKKLSKRMHGEVVWVRSYRDQGYLPEAFVNYLALVGWNPGGDREHFTLSELIEAFSLERVHVAGGIFDPVKLDDVQRHYVKQLSKEALMTRLGSYLDEQGLARPSEPLFGRMVGVIQDRLGRLAEFTELTSYLVALEDYPAGRLIFKKSTSEGTERGLLAALSALEGVSNPTWESIDALAELLARVTTEELLTNGDLFWPVRVALTGLDRSASPAECLWVLGRDESLRRLRLGSEKLERLRNE